MLKKKKHDADDDDDFRARAKKGAQQKQERGRFKFPPNQETTFRILKTPRDRELNSPSVFMYWKLHRHVGPNDGWGRCGHDADGNGECWLCDVKIPELRKKGLTKKASAHEADDVFSVKVAVKDENTGEWRGPLRYDCGVGGPKSMNYRMEQLIQSTKRDCVDPKKGYGVTIERTGSGLSDTTYGPSMFDEEPSAVPIQIMKRLRPFEDHSDPTGSSLPEYDEDRLKAAYYGRDVEEQEEEQEERRPKRKPGKVREEEEPEEEEGEETESEESEEEEESEPEEEEESEEETEEEEEKPRGKKPGKKPARKPKEEEEEYEEVEEESEGEEEESEEESSESEEEESEPEEEEEEPKRKPGKKPAKKSKREEPEEEEEYEEVEEESEEEESEPEEEEEEEPQPKKKPVKKPLKKKH